MKLIKVIVESTWQIVWWWKKYSLPGKIQPLSFCFSQPAFNWFSYNFQKPDQGFIVDLGVIFWCKQLNLSIPWVLLLLIFLLNHVSICSFNLNHPLPMISVRSKELVKIIWIDKNILRKYISGNYSGSRLWLFKIFQQMCPRNSLTFWLFSKLHVLR